LNKRLSDRAKAEFVREAHHLPQDQASHAGALIAQPDFNIFYNANTLITICAQGTGPFVTADCWLAAQNLMLAARAEGLGTCVIGFAMAALNTPESKRELNIPGDMMAVAPIIVGVPHGDTPATSRKAPRILGHF
jgi:nitroreductase